MTTATITNETRPSVSEGDDIEVVIDKGDPRHPLVIVSVVLGIAAAAVLSWLLFRPAASSAVEAAPPIAVQDVRNPSATVGLPVGEPAVVNFLGSSCNPCREELPTLQQASVDNPSVKFVGVDVRDSRTAANDLLTETDVRFPVAYDPNADVARSYGVNNFPTTVFVDADGMVVARVEGPIDEVTLQKYLNEIGTNK